MTDERDGRERERDHSEQRGVGGSRRPYVAPELIEYGTVAKLTQTGGGSVMDFGSMMRMTTCL